MRRLPTAVLCALLIATPSATAEPDRAANPPLTVMTYNIHTGVGVDGRLDLGRVAADITASGADVVGMPSEFVYLHANAERAALTVRRNHPSELFARFVAGGTLLLDRGLLAPGHRADINVVDHCQLSVGRPELVFDLPSGGKRLVQRPTGYRHTFVAGTETLTDGEFTGEALVPTRRQ